MASRARLAAERAWKAASLPNYVIKSADFTAELDSEYLVDCSSNHVNIILPMATPGRFVNIGDYNSTIGVYNIGITTTGGQLIHGSTEEFIITSPNAVFVMLYIDNVIGWKVVEAMGENGMGTTGESVGSIKMWGTATIPEGWIELDGRPAADLVQYPELLALYPNGLFDMRGRFPAGYSAGGAVAPVLGQYQQDQIQNITGKFIIAPNGDLSYGLGIHSVEGVFDRESIGIGNSVDGSFTPYNRHKVVFDASRVARTGDRTIVENIALKFIIKAYDSVQNTGRLDFVSVDNKVTDIDNRVTTLEASETVRGSVALWTGLAQTGSVSLTEAYTNFDDIRVEGYTNILSGPHRTSNTFSVASISDAPTDQWKGIFVYDGSLFAGAWVTGFSGTTANISSSSSSYFITGIYGIKY